MAGKVENASAWRYVIVLGKTLVLFVDAGTSKSFGVLIPVMVERFDSDYATVGLICSMPTTLMYLCCPIVIPLLQRFSKRSVAMSGGLLTGLCLVVCAFINYTALLGVCLALSGVGLSMAYMIVILAINDYFPERFVLMSSVTCYGYTAGSMLLPIVTERSLEAYGYPGAFLILGGIALNIVVCGAAIRNALRLIGSNNLRSGSEEPRASSEERREGSEKRQTGLEKRRLGSGEARKCSDESQEHPIESNEMVEASDESKRLLCEDKHIASNGLEHGSPGQYKNQWENQRQMKQCVEPSAYSGILSEWMILFSLPTHLVMFYLIYSWMLFLVPHTEELGILPSTAIYLSTIGGVGGILGRLAFTTLIAKGVQEDKGLMAYIIIGAACAATFLMDFAGSAYEIRALLAFVQGFCLFFQDQLIAFLIKYLMCNSENFDVAFAISSFAGGMGATCSGFFTGWLFDVTQSFTKVFIIIGFIHAVMAGHLTIILILKRRHRSVKNILL